MKIAKSLYPSKEWILDAENSLFPRGQHPDHRSDHEALTAIETKLKVNSLRRKPVNSGSFLAKPLMCLNTGQIFPGLRVAALITGVSSSQLSLQINGKIQEVNGLKFKWL